MTRVPRALAMLAALAALASLPGDAAADRGEPPGAVPGDPAEALAAAAEALAVSDFGQVLALARPVASGGAAPADRAEAHRLLGLAYFFLGDSLAAEAELLAWLRLDLDARLDPSQVPPEAVTFFEDVRARNAAELRKRRPRQRRYALLNLLPPGGQLQNGERGKAIALGVAEVTLLAVNVATYVALTRACRTDDFTCEWDGADDPGRARLLRSVNLLSGAALVGVYLYGVVDGLRGYRRAGRVPPPVVVVAPQPGGLVAGASLSF